MELQTLTTADLTTIHERLVEDFASTRDPISPPGVRSIALLEPAVGRQHTGLGETLKYPRPIENAATLAYGICCHHAFHNGNKRTALVAMLVHLDRNKSATTSRMRSGALARYSVVLVPAMRCVQPLTAG